MDVAGDDVYRAHIAVGRDVEAATGAQLDPGVGEGGRIIVAVVVEAEHDRHAIRNVQVAQSATAGAHGRSKRRRVGGRVLQHDGDAVGGRISTGAGHAGEVLVVELDLERGDVLLRGGREALVPRGSRLASNLGRDCQRVVDSVHMGWIGI